jgi:hypothetical protein
MCSFQFSKQRFFLRDTIDMSQCIHQYDRKKQKAYISQTQRYFLPYKYKAINRKVCRSIYTSAVRRLCYEDHESKKSSRLH